MPRLAYIKDYLQKLADLQERLGGHYQGLEDINSPQYLKLLKDADWGSNLTLRDLNRLQEAAAGGYNTVNSVYQRNALLLPDTTLYRGLGLDKERPFQERQPFAQSLTIDPELAAERSRSVVKAQPSDRFPWLPNPFSGENEFLLPENRRLKLLSDDPTAEELDVMRTGYGRGGEVASKLAKLASLLRGLPAEAAPAARTAAPVAQAAKEYTATGRAVPRDDEIERLQSLVSNQPTEAGNYQWAVVKPSGDIHGAPFDFKGSALRIADALNQNVPGHTVQALSVDNPAISRYAMRTPDPQANPFRKSTPEEIDALLSQKPGMAEGGPVEGDQGFDPIASARDRYSSSPGSPGISGAIKDAIEALQSYLHATGSELGEERRHNLETLAGVEEHAEGGTIDEPATEHEEPAGLGKRFGVRVMEQAYGLDDSGKPVLGGRAWTSTQGGTPMGLLDEIAASPHNLLSLARTVRGLDPLRKLAPGYNEAMGTEDKWLDALDPQWSQDAAARLDKLRSAMNQRFNVGEAHTFPEHMVDAAASLASPIPMTKAGEEAGLAKRLLEMSTPLRPRTMKNYATDTAVLGGLGTGIDSMIDRLTKLKAQQAQNALPTRNPESFSSDMGLQPEDRDIHNTHEMHPLVDEHGNIYGYGVDPETL